MNTDLWTPTAAILAGRAVRVRWQQPVWDFALGAAYKTLDHTAIVDIYPDAAPETVFQLYLHELAHIRQDWQSMTPSDIWRSAPRSQSLPPVTRTALRALPREPAADNLAEQWQVYAARHAWDYERTGRSMVDMRLLALQDFYPAEKRLQTILDRAVQAGIKKAIRERG